jgi:hypothetical protein
VHGGPHCTFSFSCAWPQALPPCFGGVRERFLVRTPGPHTAEHFHSVQGPSPQCTGHFCMLHFT